VIVPTLELDPQLQRGLRARITAAHAPDERLQMWVPIEMKDVYEMEMRTLTGTATYTNFRPFETEVRLLGVKQPQGAGPPRHVLAPAQRRSRRRSHSGGSPTYHFFK